MECVDNLKVSHEQGHIVNNFIADMNKEFGKETLLNQSQGKVHDYLGMTLDYCSPGSLTIHMINYIKFILHDIPDDRCGMATTPVGHHLFLVSSYPVLLSKDKATTFVHLVMQLLYLRQRAQPDIHTVISFLCG
jgi:hypothetical protein